MLAAPTLTMTRRVAFSSGHRYWLPKLDEAGNRALFGQWASRFSHGHNYALEVTVRGEVDPVTGMIVNIKRIDDVLKELILAPCDGKSLNDEVPYFHDRAPTVENILRFVQETLTREPLPGEVDLVALKLEETPLLYGELIDNIMTLTRVYEFAASHRLHAPTLSDQENEDLFGKCNNPAGHGHNYVLEVSVEGTPDEQTGMLTDIGALDDKVNELVVDRYDHKNFNADIPEFENRPTTSEYVALEIFNRLNNRLPAKLHRIRLFETARNIFEVTA